MKTRTYLRSSSVLSLLAATSLLSMVACSASPNTNTTDVGGSGGSGNGGAGGDIGNGGAGGDDTIAGSGGATNTITESCGSSTFANQVPGSILIVLDKSGSMSGGDGQPDKWGPTVDAVKSMMSSASPELGMGLLPFPEGKFNDAALAGCAANLSSPMCVALFGDGGCEDIAMMPVVEVAPLTTSKSAITSWLDSNDPGGGTPTLGALKRGYDYMRAASAPGERFVLLLTDGEPTTHQPATGFGGFTIPESNIKCGELADIEAEALAAAAGSPKVKTFVIGSPGSEAAGKFLSQLAINGETPRAPGCSAGAKDCHYQIGKANYQQELETVLADIAGKLSECVFEIPDGENADPDYVNVTLQDGAFVTTPLYKDAAHADGWDYTDDSHTKVELFGPACDKFKNDKDVKVSIILGCKTEVK